MLSLEDLTKDELLKLILRFFLEVPQRNIVEVRRESLLAKANTIMTEAQEEMKDNIGGGYETIKRFQQASKKFDEGMALTDKASKMLEELRVK